MKFTRNPLSGRLCSGYRFQFKVPAIDPLTLYLPLEMKVLLPVRQLINGMSPIAVFNASDLAEARRAFRMLRKKYDFDYWAVKEYFIPDVANPDSIVPLRLNDAQAHVIDILRKRYFEKKTGRYIISKSIRRCGLTTCIQAYFLWMQSIICHNNSYICGPSDINLLPLKKNLCRFLHRDIVPHDPWIYIPKADRRAFLFTLHSPDAIRGINLGYVHFADLSKWHDPHDKYSSRAFIAALGAVLIDFFTLVVLEGDLSTKCASEIDLFIKNIPNEKRGGSINKFSKTFQNSFFINHIVVSRTQSDPHFFYIHLSSSILNDLN